MTGRECVGRRLARGPLFPVKRNKSGSKLPAWTGRFLGADDVVVITEAGLVHRINADGRVLWSRGPFAGKIDLIATSDERIGFRVGSAIFLLASADGTVVAEIDLLATLEDLPTSLRLLPDDVAQIETTRGLIVQLAPAGGPATAS